MQLSCSSSEVRSLSGSDYSTHSCRRRHSRFGSSLFSGISCPCPAQVSLKQAHFDDLKTISPFPSSSEGRHVEKAPHWTKNKSKSYGAYKSKPPAAVSNSTSHWHRKTVSSCVESLHLPPIKNTHPVGHPLELSTSSHTREERHGFGHVPSFGKLDIRLLQDVQRYLPNEGFIK
mmetsp:Transcript_4729/g.7350  ORF Transcript_4729/g.7350 Transcript_4729/m.7350 type:complete len:174 (+) Transcript_4729:200-721(+)